MKELFLQIFGNIVEAIEAKYYAFVELAPSILGALAVFLFGWLLAELASRTIIGMSDKLKLDWLSDKLGLKHFLERTGGGMSASQLIAQTVKGYLIFLFFIESTKIAQLDEVANFLTRVIEYIPDVIVAIFIMLVGLRIANSMQLLITTSLDFAKSNTAKILGLAARYTIFTFAVLAALSQLQIADTLIQTLFIGFISMLALAGGLAFGLGGKDVVRELLEAIKGGDVHITKKEKKG